MGHDEESLKEDLATVIEISSISGSCSAEVCTPGASTASKQVGTYYGEPKYSLVLLQDLCIGMAQHS